MNLNLDPSRKLEALKSADGWTEGLGNTTEEVLQAARERASLGVRSATNLVMPLDLLVMLRLLRESGLIQSYNTFILNQVEKNAREILEQNRGRVEKYLSELTPEQIKGLLELRVSRR